MNAHSAINQAIARARGEGWTVKPVPKPGARQWQVSQMGDVLMMGEDELLRFTAVESVDDPSFGETPYLDLLAEVYEEGVYREGRNGGTYGLFGRQIRFDLSKGFPLLTTKRVHFKSVKVELLWFIRGDTNVEFLHEHGVTIWDEWADREGNLGPVYGRQWRQFPQVRLRGDHMQTTPNTFNSIAVDGYWIDFAFVDQLKKVVEGLKADPYGRRHIVTAWNPAEIDKMALPPCHCMFQFFVADGKLSCLLFQRSADVFLGVPFNVASYALLTHMVAQEVGLEVGDFVHSFGDVHLYANHIDQAVEQLGRAPRALPRLSLEPDKSLFDMVPDDIAVVDYDPHPAIKAEVSV